MPYSDEDLLKIVGEERRRSIGFGEGVSSELTNARDTALAYYKGEMADVPSLPNRSKAVDTTVADAIETVLPDVLEIFVGGDDVATFTPQGEGDEERAKEETDFVNHVVFTENEGFLLLYTAIKDAMLTRTGIIHWWWEDEEKEKIEQQGLTQDLLAVAQQMAPQMEAEEQEDGSFSLKSTTLHGKAKIKAFPSEDFSCAADTVSLRDATYCVVRDRPRVQDLIARGIDPDKARDLPTYSSRSDTVEIARDEAGEHDRPQDGSGGDLRIVEVRAHYIRLDADGAGKLDIWRIVTDAEERVMLDKERVGQIPFAALTPYIIPHRFYGESVADKLIEVQKIKTALLRMFLDSGYFALNQRNYVASSLSNEFTVSDLLRNEPGVPVRGAGPGAVTPLAAGSLNFNPLEALEYAATIAESRSGIVRNAQGLNPDTLHKTAQGAMALIGAAQKRVRLIARIFAETGIKDLFLGVHYLLRTASTDDHAPMQAKLGSSWKTVQPHQWPERCAMAIHVGVGSAGKEHDLIVADKRLEMMQAMVMEQGGMSGPLLDANNVHNALTDWERAAGSKKADQFWSDPKTAQPQPPKPDPAMEKVQADIQTERMKAAAAAQLAKEKAATDLQTQREQMAAKAEADREAAVNGHNLKMIQLREELDMEREKLAIQLENQREIELIKARNTHEIGMTKITSPVDQVEAGGEPG